MLASLPVSVIVLIAMTLLVLVVAAYRKLVARDEDDFVHLAEGTSQLVLNQEKTAHALQTLDRIGVALTIATAVYGAGLFALYLYVGLTRH